MLNVTSFRLRCTQKFSTRRKIVKQRANLDGGSRRVPCRFDLPNLPAVNLDPGAFSGFILPGQGGQCHPANARDTRDRLPAKSHRGDGCEVIGGLDLAGRVALKAKQRIVPVHADAVVGHTNQAPSARLNLHRDSCRPGVQSIFNQFLDHAGRALDHLTGGDLIGNSF